MDDLALAGESAYAFTPQVIALLERSNEAVSVPLVALDRATLLAQIPPITLQVRDIASGAIGAVDRLTEGACIGAGSRVAARITLSVRLPPRAAK